MEYFRKATTEEIYKAEKIGDIIDGMNEKDYNDTLNGTATAETLKKYGLTVADMQLYNYVFI